MNKYIVIYHAPVEALKQMENTPPEEAAEGMKVWMEWAEKCGDKLVDLGNPLGNGQQVDVDGKSSPSDKQVCGYSILKAENMDAARELLDSHPHISGWDQGCTIEVHEVLPLPGQDQI